MSDPCPTCGWHSSLGSAKKTAKRIAAWLREWAKDPVLAHADAAETLSDAADAIDAGRFRISAE